MSWSDCINSRGRSMKSIKLALVGVLAWSWAFFIPASYAGMISVQEVVTEQSLRLEIQALIDRADVQAQLVKLGVTEAEAKARIDRMTTAELQEVHAKWQALPAAGDVAGLIAFLFIVFVVTDMMCATDLFTFVKCIHEPADVERPRDPNRTYPGERYSK